MKISNQAKPASRLSSDGLRAQSVSTPSYVDSLIALANMASELNFSEAAAILKEALTYAELLNYGEGLTIVLNRLAWVHLQQGMIEEALIEASRAEFVAQQQKMRGLALSAGFVIATIHHRAGQTLDAERRFQTLAAEAESTKDFARQADYLASLALISSEKGQFAEALKMQMEAHRLYAALNDPNLALSCNSIAMTLLDFDKPEEAEKWVSLALALCPPQVTSWRCSFLHTLGRCKLNLGAEREAQTHFEAAIRLAKETNNDAISLVEAMVDMGKLLLRNGNAESGFAQLDEALRCAQGARNHALEVAVHHALRAAYSDINAFALAAVHAERHTELSIQNQVQKSECTRAVARAEQRLPKLYATWQHSPFAASTER